MCLFFVRAGDMLLDIHSPVMCKVYACLRLGLSSAGLDTQRWPALAVVTIMAKVTQLWFVCVPVVGQYELFWHHLLRPYSYMLLYVMEG